MWNAPQHTGLEPIDDEWLTLSYKEIDFNHCIREYWVLISSNCSSHQLHSHGPLGTLTVDPSAQLESHLFQMVQRLPPSHYIGLGTISQTHLPLLKAPFHMQLPFTYIFQHLRHCFLKMPPDATATSHDHLLRNYLLCLMHILQMSISWISLQQASETRQSNLFLCDDDYMMWMCQTTLSIAMNFITYPQLECGSIE